MYSECFAGEIFRAKSLEGCIVLFWWWSMWLTLLQSLFLKGFPYFCFPWLSICVSVTSRCIILLCRSVVVSAGLLRIFGRHVAELPMVATSREHQGKVGALLHSHAWSRIGKHWNLNVLYLLLASTSSFHFQWF